MHVLYVHQNFPAQFGHIARHLVRQLGWRCTFVSQTPSGNVEGIEKIQYTIHGGATKQNHYCSRSFENTVWHCDGVYRALRDRTDINPDLIVAHSGFGSSLFLREVYGDTPIVNFFEYYYRPHCQHSDMDFRKDLPWQVPEENYLRSYCRNAMILLDLQNCNFAYVPTTFQKSRFPAEYQQKLQVIFDGIDRNIYHSFNDELRPRLASRGVRQIAGVQVPPTTRVVTYVSRGFESMRGFDIFMQSAKLIAQRHPDVLFFVVGTDRVAYGGDANYIKPHETFKQWTLAQQEYDLSKFIFTGHIPQDELARLMASSDLHIYLTVPFVLSWSMMDAMSCGAVVLGSRTPPVMEMIRDGENGLLADFFSPEEIADKAVQVLADPDAHRPLGRSAEQMVVERYSLEAVLPEMTALYEKATAGRAPAPATRPAKPPLSAVLTEPMASGPAARPQPPRQPKSPFLG